MWEAADSWGDEKWARHGGGGVSSGHGRPTGPQKAAPSEQDGVSTRGWRAGSGGFVPKFPSTRHSRGQGPRPACEDLSPVPRPSRPRAGTRTCRTSLPSPLRCPVPRPRCPTTQGCEHSGGRHLSYRAPPFTGLASPAPLPCRERREASQQSGVSGPAAMPCPARLHPAVPASRIGSAKLPTAAAQGLENGAPQPLGDWAGAWLHQPSALPGKGQPEGRALAPRPQHTRGTPAPQLLSIPRRRRSRDPHRARGLHRFPRHHPGSPTPAGPPRVPRPALLGPRGRVPALSTSLTPANQKLPGLSGLICVMGHAPSPPQGTPRTALAAQRRAIHQKSLDWLPGVWTGH